MAVAAIALAQGASWSVAALGATDVAALVFVGWVWISVAGADTAATARRARSEDVSRTAAEAILLGAGAASLLAVVFTLAQASHSHAGGKGLLTVLALVSVALAWSAVHTVYALRYARLYYSPPDGGIDFQGGRPEYLDFAYLALTIGMTFQVSDTDLTAKRVRRQALRHALTCYVFGTVIVATRSVRSLPCSADSACADRLGRAELTRTYGGWPRSFSRVALGSASVESYRAEGVCMFKNSPLERGVIARLEDDPSIADSAEIAVAGDGGIITRRGTVERFSQRHAAEHDALGVDGVSEVINYLKVDLPGSDRRQDDEIRGAARQNLMWDVEVPSAAIDVEVEDGRVTLTGDVTFQFQSDAAYDDVSRLYGVAGVTNEIRVTSP